MTDPIDIDAVIRGAQAVAQDIERTRVVAFLRAGAKAGLGFEEANDALACFANAIEEGEHLLDEHLPPEQPAVEDLEVRIVRLVPDSDCGAAGGGCSCGILRQGCRREFYRMNPHLLAHDARKGAH